MRNFALVFGLKTSPRLERDQISKIALGPEKSSGVLRNARQAPIVQKVDSVIHQINHYPVDKY